MSGKRTHNEPHVTAMRCGRHVRLKIVAHWTAVTVLIFELAAVALPAAAVSEHGVRAGFRLPTATQ